MTVINEDARYRMSSQFRLWSFTPESLASLRQSTNDTAADHVRKRRKLSHNTSSETSQDAEPLTASEELHAIQHIYLPQLRHISNSYFAFLPAHTLQRTIATASQYLRRYYLSHSLMAPTPSQASPGTPSPAKHAATSAATTPQTLSAPVSTILAALYLAMKVHDLPYSLSDFVSRVVDKGAREGLQGADTLTIEGMKRAEQSLTRTLRFCFDVRHAVEGVKGLELDLGTLVKEPEALTEKGEIRRHLLRTELLRLPRPDALGDEEPADDSSTEQARTRTKTALQAAEKTLRSSVHASDVYFLYTPSQILFAALMLADQSLAEWYLGTKFPTPVAGQDHEQIKQEPNEATANEASNVFNLRDKIFTTIRSCAEMLRAAAAAKADKKELASLKSRLAACQAVLDSSPTRETSEDNSEASRATSVKRGAGFSSSGDDEDDEDVIGPGEKAKRRKKRRIEDDDVFGPVLK